MNPYRHPNPTTLAPHDFGLAAIPPSLKTRPRWQFLSLCLLWLSTFCLGLHGQAVPVNCEARSVTTSGQMATLWKKETFERIFTTIPIVVMGPAISADGDPHVIRIRNVTKTGFEWMVDEWDYLDGQHPGAITVHFLAITPGDHAFGTSRWRVGTVSGGVGRSTVSVSLTGVGFTAPPVVLAQVRNVANFKVAQTNPKALKTRLSEVTSTGFKVHLETQQADTTTLKNEVVDYIVVSSGSGYLDGKWFNATVAANKVGNTAVELSGAAMTNPLFLGQTQSKNDTDPGDLRMTQVTATGATVSFQEETSSDKDLAHAKETVGYLRLGDMAGESATKLIILDTPLITADGTTWRKEFNIPTSYDTPVVVAGPMTRNADIRGAIRIRNVLGNDPANGGRASFEFMVEKRDTRDSGVFPGNERVQFIVMEKGTYAVGGQRWVAGVKTGAVATAYRVGFPTSEAGFPSTPVVFSQVVTTVDPTPVNARVHTISPTGFQLKLDEIRTDYPAHGGETVHYLAMEKGTSNFFSIYQGFRFQTATTNTLDGTWRINSFSRNHADPYLFAAVQGGVAEGATTIPDDQEPVTVRYKHLFADRVSFIADEDYHANSSRHAAEVGAWLVIQGDTDTDGDGLPNAVETQWKMNPNLAADGAADTDGDALTKQMEWHNGTEDTVFNGGTIVLTSGDGGAAKGQPGTGSTYEKYATANSTAPKMGSFTFWRNDAIAPLTVKYTIGLASDDVGKGVATCPQDFTLRPSASLTEKEVLTGSFTFPANTYQKTLFVHPVQDNLIEYPEGFSITVTADPQYKIGTTTAQNMVIYDANDVPDQELIYAGTFIPKKGAVTSASGIAHARLNGPRNVLRINVSFSGLTTPEPASGGSHLRFVNDQWDIPIADLGSPRGPFVASSAEGVGIWKIPNTGLMKSYNSNATPLVITGQGVLGALGGSVPFLEVAVRSARYPEGEIAAKLQSQPRDKPFQASDPLAAPALEDLANEEEVRRDCVRFLTQATFGPSSYEVSQLFDSIAKPKTSAANRLKAFNQWIDAQWAKDQTTSYDLLRALEAEDWNILGKSYVLDLKGKPYKGDHGYSTYPCKPEDWARWGTGKYPFPYEDFPIRSNNGRPPDYFRAIARHTIALQGHDQLRQRVGFALEQLFVISDRSLQFSFIRPYGHSRFTDMLADHVDGKRDVYPPNVTPGAAVTFRDLIKDVSLHPMMAWYLSHMLNAKATEVTYPDQNYAREVMQLFTIGLVELDASGTPILDADGNPIPTYKQEDVAELAKIFTGWTASKTNSRDYPFACTDLTKFTLPVSWRYHHAGYEYPMQVFCDFHEENAKTLLGKTRAAYVGSSEDKPARKAYAEADLDWAMDLLFNHKNTPSFVSRRLIQRLVTSNPSRGYVYRVAQKFINNGKGVRGSIPDVIRAILTDYEARSLKFVDPQLINGQSSVNVSHGKMKEPILRFFQLMRALECNSKLKITMGKDSWCAATGYPESQADNLYRLTTGGVKIPATQMRFGDLSSSLGQSMGAAPSVFNWYQPDYSMAGPLQNAGLYTPEFQIASESNVVDVINAQYAIALEPAGASQLLEPMRLSWTDPAINPYTNMPELRGHEVVPNLKPWIDLYQKNKDSVLLSTTRLMDALDMLLLAGGLKAEAEVHPAPSESYTAKKLRDAIINQVGRICHGSGDEKSTIERRVRNAIYLITSTPEFIIQK